MMGAMSTASTQRRPIYPIQFKIAAVVILAVVAVLSVIAYQMLAEESEDNAGGGNDFVEAFLPPDGSQALQQETVGIDLAPGWQAKLFVLGEEVPEDQLRVVQSLNRLEFSPGEGKLVEAWSPGQNCLAATVWESAAGIESSSRNVSWCFEVV